MSDNDTSTSDGGVTHEQADYVVYGIDDRPPLLESALLGFQHYLTMIGSTIAIPLALAGALGMFTEAPGQVGRLIGTFFVVSGIATLAQTTIGNRYPIVQGGTFSMLAPAFAIIGALGAQGVGWQVTLLELQGAIIAAAAIQVVIGYVGLMGALKRYLSPVVIAPTIALIGLALFSVPQITDPTFDGTGTQNWWMVGITLGLIILFSQYLANRNRFFKLYPVLLGVGAAWLIAWLASVGGIFAQGTIGYVSFASVGSAPLIQPVYPLQWGMPQFTLPFAIGMFAGAVASMIESFGDYHAVARLSGRGAPSPKRINHGIGMEGLGNMFAGIMGTGNGSTSYSENIGAIGITGVASRYVVQVGAVVMIIAGYFGPFGALVASIPTPIVAGLFIAMFGQIVAVGLSMLKYVDLDSGRNTFIVGIALFVGLAIPAYMGNVGGAAGFAEGMGQVALIGPILGAEIVADTLFVIGSTGMAIGGLTAFVLDNTIEGTREERGLTAWEEISEKDSDFLSIADRVMGRGQKAD